MDPGAREHWDSAYTTKPETGVSWFQAEPALSLHLIRDAAPRSDTAIIDIGGGASRIADRLVADGYSDLTVLDISPVALSRTKARLGSRADGVNWIVADITAWHPHRTWDVWHDRAVFHFLIQTEAQDAYLRALAEATREGSAIIIATFALTGPERCSGLPVHRYSVETLAARLGSGFNLYDTATERHDTPFGTVQDFVYAAFRRR